MQTKYLNEYVDAVQKRIEECEDKVRLYSSDLVMDQDGIKNFTRNYIA